MTGTRKIGARAWRLEATSSRVAFTASIAGRIDVRGEFPLAIAGSVEEADGTLSGSAVVDAAAIRTGIGRRDRHLRSKDFLDVRRHPQIALSVDGISREAGVQRAVATVTIKGHTAPVDVEVQVRDGGATVRGTLRRQDVGITPRLLAQMVVADEIAFEAHVVLVPA